MGTKLDEYHEHEGPARGCAFHPSQPIFASCGDDYTVRVYNYRTKRALFTLAGHMDYVRSVQFHPDAPWLMSASDDQTVRIWNWQSRQCLSVLTGHSHYVMCAQFHPKEDLVVSASLDQTVRIWDVSGLRRKGSSSAASPIGGGSSSGGNNFMSPRSSGQLDLFAAPDGAVKFILEGHERGVNWVAFHPTKPLIASGSDDRTVKLWRFNDIRAWEVDTLRGHQNNVSAVIFHPKLDLVFSNSEDKTMKIWDISGLTGSSTSSSAGGKKVQTIKRDERFWSLAAHPDANLLAYGHDEGFAVFKMEPERPPFVVSDNTVYYFNDKVLKSFPLTGEGGKSQPLMTADHRISLPSSLAHNPAEEAVLLSMSGQNKYELYCLRSGDIKHGTGCFGVYTAKNRFAVLDTSSNTVNVMSMDNSVYRSFTVEEFAVKRLLPAFTGTVFLVGEETVMLWDLQQNRQICQISVPNCKYVAWSRDHQHVAFLSKKSIHLVRRHQYSLEVLGVVEEPNQVKSAVWGEDGAMLYYTNAHHLKYVLVPIQPESSGAAECGVVCTVDRALYLLRVQEESVYVVDRQGALQVITIDPTEPQFKLALQCRDFAQVADIIERSPLVGQAIISYLRKNGYAQVALQFVQDAGSRFELAIEAGRLDVALREAERLNNKQCWLRLGEAAVTLGDIEVAEAAYKSGGWEEKWSFLLLITGQFEKLKRGASTVSQSQSVHNMLMLGDWSGLCEALSEVNPSLSQSCREKPTVGSIPVNTITTSWPLSEPLARDDFGALGVDNSKSFEQVEEQDVPSFIKPEKSVQPVMPPPNMETGWGDDDLSLESDEFEVVDGGNIHEEASFESVNTGGFAQTLPGPGKPLFSVPSDTPWNCIVNGEYELCKEMLGSLYGVSQFEPLLPTIEQIIMKSRSYHEGGKSVVFVPVVEDSSSTLLEDYEKAHSLLTNGQFNDAYELFLHTFYMSLFVDDPCGDLIRKEGGEYIRALQLELTRRDLPSEDHQRSLELACYFTHFAVRIEHVRLSLRSAMTAAYKQHCYRLAAKLARRLLDTANVNDQPSLPETVTSMAKKVLAAGEKTKQDDPIQIEYDGMKVPFVVCMKRMVQISGSGVHKCGCCGATYAESGIVCTVCRLAVV